MKKLNYIMPALAAFGLLTACSDSTKEDPKPAPADDHAHEDGKGDHAPEDRRDSMIDDVPLHLDIMLAVNRIAAGSEGADHWEESREGPRPPAEDDS